MAPDRLAAYQAKRDFSKTAEPAGTQAPALPAGRARFVVQRHRARRLHYDLRLEIDGVLASWAVPKGPTLDPNARRAAIHVEDHPLEYADFEGVIPKGEYGAGDVIVWDEGTWQADGPCDPPDPRRCLEQGELHFDLQGHKLRGRFVLVRTHYATSGKEQWLLLHKRDEHAVEGWDPEDYPRSVLSGRTNDEVRAAAERAAGASPPLGRAPAGLRPPAPASAASEELAELDELGPSGLWHVFGRELRVSNLDKVLFAGRDGGRPLTKRDFLRYTAQVAPVVTPYLAGRALNMYRFPDGAQSKGFWQKQLPPHAPAWLPRWQGPGSTGTYLVVDEPAALVWAANFGALEWHAWTSRTSSPGLPTYVLFDLDPGEATSWEDLVVLARLHRTALEHLGVAGFPKLSGKRGIHVWVPITPGPSFSEARAWAEALSRAVGAVVPDLVSWKWELGGRGGLARLDYTQNAPNKTLVAPYSPRASPGAPVSAPLEWAELDDPSLRPDMFNVANMAERLAEKGDLFAPALKLCQRLPELR